MKTTSPENTSVQHETLLRLPQVLTRYPVSRSSWYQGIKAGNFPAPVKLGPRAAAWRESDIDTLIRNISKAAQ